jgi:hypothetical protein
MKDMFLIGIPILILIALYVLSFERSLKKSPYFLIFTVVVALVYSGYLIGSTEAITISRVFLIVIFLGGGVWRLFQYNKVINSKTNSSYHS